MSSIDPRKLVALAGREWRRLRAWNAAHQRLTMAMSVLLAVAVALGVVAMQAPRGVTSAQKAALHKRPLNAPTEQPASMLARSRSAPEVRSLTRTL
jgi:negative regulator of sigma E activity